MTKHPLPRPSPHFIEAARILAEIEWRERFGFDCGDLEAELVRTLERYTIEVVFGMRLLPTASFV